MKDDYWVDLDFANEVTIARDLDGIWFPRRRGHSTPPYMRPVNN